MKKIIADCVRGSESKREWDPEMRSLLAILVGKRQRIFCAFVVGMNDWD